MEKLKGNYHPYVLSDKINSLIDSHNRLEEAVRYLADVHFDGDGKTLNKINQILKGEPNA